MSKRAVIIGALGLIGTEALKKFHANGVDIIAIDERTPQKQILQLPGITWLNGSVDDSELINSIVQSGDDIFHFAETSSPGHPGEYEEGMKALSRLNKLCAMCVLKNCRLIYPSSGGTVYGRAMRTPITEEHPLEPKSLYGLFKKNSEDTLSYYNRIYGLQTIIMRIANCYGDHFNSQKKQGIINVAASSLIHGERISLVAEGKQVRDFIHTIDVANLCLTILMSDVEYTIVNVGSGKGISMLETVKLIASYLNVSPNIDLLSSRPFDVMDNILDSTKASKLFGWTAQISLEEGIEKICKTIQMQN